MKVSGKRWILHNGRGDEFSIWNVSDIHFGNKACAIDEFIKDRETILNDPFAFFVGGGDYCLPIDAEILTKNGFKKYNELCKDDEVLGYNGVNTVWTKLLGVYYNENCELNLLKSQTFEILATDNHHWIVSDTHEKRRKFHKEKWPKKIATKNLKTHHRILLASPCLENGNLDITDDEAWLLGWVVTDGWISKHKYNSLVIGIAQSNKKYALEIESRLNQYITKNYLQKDGSSNFNISIPKVRKICNKMNIEPYEIKQKIEWIVCNISVSAREAMFDAMLKAEGWIENGRYRFAQKRGTVLNAFLILCVLKGIRIGNSKERNDNVVTVGLMKRGHYVTVADLKMSKDVFMPVWCPRTELGSWIYKYKNQVGITGNCEYISCTDSRFDPDCVSDFVKIKDLGRLGKTFTEGVRELFKPIKHKCLGLLYGNHELKYEKWQEQQGLHEWLCTELGVPNLGYSALFDVVFERGKVKEPVLKFEASKTINYHHSQSFRFYVHHGAGFSTTPAGKLTRLIRFMSYFDANVFMTGHVHDQEGRRMVEIGADSTCTKLIEKHKLGIISGSYLKTYEENVTTYGEQRGYEPTVLGASKVILLPQAKNPKDRIRGEI